VAALTLYDMLKMFDTSMAVEEVVLVDKRGGKSDFATRLEPPPRAAVIVLSDSAAAGHKADLSGRLLHERLQAAGFEVQPVVILPDEPERLVAALTACADAQRLDLVLTSGGTGLGPRDRTPEAMDAVFEREVPGLAEALREHGRERTPFAALGRGRAGVRGTTLIVNLPGSPDAARDALDAGLRTMQHALSMLHGGSHPHADAARSRPT
jgi:molybdenum cofactor synthesis domain-containing protein